jgi:site-specific DNA recombinase
MEAKLVDEVCRVATYVRVSTLEQANAGYSLEQQSERLLSYCRARDWQIVESYLDPGYSGTTLQRPGLQALLDLVRAGGVDLVLVYKLDRLSRSQQDTLHLIEDVFAANAVGFASLCESFDTSTSFGRAIVGILSAFAQLEREQIRERMALGRLGRIKSGKSSAWAQPPFGYRYADGALQVISEQAETIAQVFNWFLNEMSISGIARRLNEEGHRGKKNSWSYNAVRRVLSNVVYTGRSKYKDHIYDGLHLRIINDDIFEAAQRRLGG